MTGWDKMNILHSENIKWTMVQKGKSKKFDQLYILELFLFFSRVSIYSKSNNMLGEIEYHSKLKAFILLKWLQLQKQTKLWGRKVMKMPSSLCYFKVIVWCIYIWQSPWCVIQDKYYYSRADSEVTSRTMKPTSHFTSTYQDYGKFKGIEKEKIRGTRKNSDFYERPNYWQFWTTTTLKDLHLKTYLF